MASIVDRKKGEIFFNLGLTLHQIGNHIEAAKHFQWALKLSPDNKKISESIFIKEHHCDNNPQIPCNLKKPEKHKTEGSDTITTPNYMPSYGGSGYWIRFVGLNKGPARDNYHQNSNPAPGSAAAGHINLGGNDCMQHPAGSAARTTCENP